MSTSNSSGVKIFAEGGETDHGLPLSPEKLQVVMDVQAVCLYLPPPPFPFFPSSRMTNATTC